MTISRLFSPAPPASGRVNRLSRRRARRMVEAWQQVAKYDGAPNTRLQLTGAAQLLQSVRRWRALLGGLRRPQLKRYPLDGREKSRR
jgi:hypothetical protein